MTPMTTDPVREHRIDYWAWVELHAVPAMRDTLLRLRDHWLMVNDTYFDGVMTLPYITLTEPSTPSTYGQCCSVSTWGSRLEIKLRPSLLTGTHPHMAAGEMHEAGRLRFVADVLTHEAIHQYHREISGKTEVSYRGHGPAFTNSANTIGAKLGLLGVAPRNRKGTKVAIASNWPHCVRDPAYYLGAYVPPTRDTTTVKTVTCPCCDGTGRVEATAPAFLRLAIATGDPAYARIADVLADGSMT